MHTAGLKNLHTLYMSNLTFSYMRDHINVFCCFKHMYN